MKRIKYGDNILCIEDCNICEGPEFIKNKVYKVKKSDQILSHTYHVEGELGVQVFFTYTQLLQTFRKLQVFIPSYIRLL